MKIAITLTCYVLLVWLDNRSTHEAMEEEFPDSQFVRIGQLDNHLAPQQEQGSAHDCGHAVDCRHGFVDDPLCYAGKG